MVVVVVSDSILRDLKDFHMSYLKEALSVSETNLIVQRGKKLDFLLGPSLSVLDYIKNANIKFLLVCGGQNDLSKLMLKHGDEEVVEKMTQKIRNHLISLTCNFPHIQIVFLPLTKRAISRFQVRNHPESQNYNFISRINWVIEKLSLNLLSLSISRVLIINGEYLHCDIQPSSLLQDDGLHLSDHGLEIYLTECVVKIKAWNGL